MKLFYLIPITFLNLIAIGSVNAGCVQPFTQTMPATHLDLSPLLANKKINEFVEAPLKTAFSGAIYCTSGKSQVAIYSPFAESVAKKNLVIGFNNGQNFIKINIILPRWTWERRNVSEIDLSEFQTTYTLRATLINKPSSFETAGSSYTVSPAVIATDISRLGLLGWLVQLISDIIQFILSWHWPQHKEDIVIQPLNLTFNPVITTCAFKGPHNIKLSPISITYLLNQTSSIANLKTSLSFECNKLISGNTSRTVKTFLTSKDMASNDPYTLVDSKNNAAKGVGIRLMNSSNQFIKFGKSQNTSSGATIIWRLNAGQAAPSQGKPVKVPISVDYYITDRNKVKAGQINTTATLNFEYD